jgi:WXXGXW repeat (2 copies)
MIRFAALLVAASVLAVSVPAFADGIPIEKRPTVTKKIKKKKRIVRKRVVIEKKIAIEEKEAPPPVVVAPPPPPPPAVWMPGRWTWNAPMNTHVWVPGMYVWPTPPADEPSLAAWRIGKWMGFGRED